MIFDEASQITLEEAVPSIFRAPQAIVVGDEMQLPPTDFFSATADAQDEEGLLRRATAGRCSSTTWPATASSTTRPRTCPPRMLGWHYRSRSESLISFSNWAFYDGRLLTVPEERLAAAGARPRPSSATPRRATPNVARRCSTGPSASTSSSTASTTTAATAPRPTTSPSSCAACSRAGRGRSIGIVAFSEAQQDEIESALAALARRGRATSRDRLEAEWEREVDGQFVGLLVKNLENIQGDERDIVILSVCYGHGARRQDADELRPDQPERRRAAAQRGLLARQAPHGRRQLDPARRHHQRLQRRRQLPEELPPLRRGRLDRRRRRPRGGCSARSPSGGSSRRPRRRTAAPSSGSSRPHSRSAATRWRRGVGMSHFRCDLAVRRHGDPRHRLGVLVDGEAHDAQDDLLDRDLLRPALLRAFGWQVAQVLSSDWYRDRKGVLDRLVSLVEHGDPAPSDVEAEDDGEDPWAELDAAVEAAQPPAPIATPAAAPAAAPTVAPPASAPAAPAPAFAAKAAPGARRFEFVGGSSRKFWEIAVAGSAVTVRFGRIGAAGQTQQKLFADAATASRTAERLVREKLAKGYVEQGSTGSGAGR